ncbi:MAG: 2-succinyl-5-enolpyruvyl-6-hydroxy-3-cyclohexene-1-carboxylate synthase, partial [bacterium]|nr:2-succinyl-5-enolpyruvyl-6-hydroxy-3-cyclohexene-1-carboxylate synthase [bacterium]
MILDKTNLNSLWCSLMVEEFIRNGIDYFCISPGSRSTPITSAAARNKDAESIVIYDERNSAYHALGYARAKGKPAVVITTSGTAAANCFPAVIEASKDNLPLIILTADRPPELQSTGANQTIEQIDIFGKYVRWDYNMPCPDTNIPPDIVLSVID